MAQGKKQIGINGNEQELNSLYKELLDGLRDDIIEADVNASMYLDAIQNDPGGKELYGSLYNDSLRLKGSARDRLLKFATVFGGRVGKKEDMQLKTKEVTGSEFAWDHGQLNEIVAELKGKTAGEIPSAPGENVKPFIEPQQIRQPIQQQEEDLEDEDDEYTINTDDDDDEWGDEDEDNYDVGAEEFDDEED